MNMSAAHEGKHHSLQTRVKLSAISKACWRNPEYRAKIVAAGKGKHQSPEARAKVSLSLKGNQRTLGYKHTPETRAKMSAAHKGKCPSPETRAKISAGLERRPYSLQTRAKIGAAHKGLQVGPKNPAWLGGISRAPYAWTFNAELKEEVRRRDGYKCQVCGVPETECRGKLPVHHVNYDKKNSDPLNLVALCPSCHSRTNIRRDHWQVFFVARAMGRAKQGMLF